MPICPACHTEAPSFSSRVFRRTEPDAVYPVSHVIHVLGDEADLDAFGGVSCSDGLDSHEIFHPVGLPKFSFDIGPRIREGQIARQIAFELLTSLEAVRGKENENEFAVLKLEHE